MSTKKLQIIGSLGSNIELDATLTNEGKAADAKAVGDALALKTDQSSFDELSGLVGDKSVADQIAQAVSGISNVVRYDAKQELTEGQRAQARFNIGAAEINDIYKDGLIEYHYTWGGVTEGRDTFTIAVTVTGDGTSYVENHNFYKVSDDVLDRSLARYFNGALVRYNDGDIKYRNPRSGNNGEHASSFVEHENYYMISSNDAMDMISGLHGNSIIFAETAGSYNYNYEQSTVIFDIPSPGVYFPFYPNDNKYISDFVLSTSNKEEIYLGNATVSVSNDGALETFFEDGGHYKMATTGYVQECIGNLTQVAALTQEEYNQLGETKPGTVYMIVSGSA